MRKNIPPIFWMRLIALVFVTTGRLLHADDTSAPSDGYKTKTVPVTAGGKTIPIRVIESDPFKNVSSSNSTDKYNPSSPNFSARSSMADKTFSLSSSSLSKSNSDFKNNGQDTFITKPYTGNSSSSTVPGLDAKTSFTTANGFNRNATGFDKGYNTSTANTGQTRTAMLASNTSTTSADQNRTSTLASRTAGLPAASPLAEKVFQGPEADASRRHLSMTDDGKILISDLPNRPLTIDEVRDLINHGFKPNTDVKPAEPSKPLNDPNYKPEPLRDTPSPTSDDDKNDPVPPPGTMAAPQAPENSEPLPQP